jgi:hypothetical protein
VILNQKEQELPLPYQQVLSLIPIGKDNAIPFREIAKLMGSQDSRSIRQIISNLVTLYGYPIGCVSGTERKRGFFIVDNANELETAIHTLSSREKHIQKRMKSLITGFFGDEETVPAKFKHFLISRDDEQKIG